MDRGALPVRGDIISVAQLTTGANRTNFFTCFGFPDSSEMAAPEVNRTSASTSLFGAEKLLTAEFDFAGDSEHRPPTHCTRALNSSPIHL
jgi:hypothetical protein